MVLPRFKVLACTVVQLFAAVSTARIFLLVSFVIYSCRKGARTSVNAKISTHKGQVNEWLYAPPLVFADLLEGGKHHERIRTEDT